jgi:hypothetical protein
MNADMETRFLSPFASPQRIKSEEDYHRSLNLKYSLVDVFELDGYEPSSYFQ